MMMRALEFMRGHFVPILLLTMFLLGISQFSIPQEKSEIRTWTVDDDGPADFRVIQQAIYVADYGDTIFVRAGIYKENIIIDKPLTLIGEDKNAIIDGTGSRAISVSHNACKIQGFEIRNARQGIYVGSAEGVLPYNVNDTVVMDNYIKDCGSAIQVGSAWNSSVHPAYNTKIIDNIIINCSSSDGIYIGSGVNTVISNNTIINCIRGINIDGYYYADDMTIFKNNIMNCLYAGIQIGAGKLLISSNNIIDNNIGIMCNNSSATGEITDNYIYGNKGGIWSKGSFPEKQLSIQNNKIYLSTDFGISLNYDSTNGGYYFYISSNHVWRNKHGIDVRYMGEPEWAISGIVYNNTLENNDFGAYLAPEGGSIDGLKFYHNNFIDNGQQAYCHSWPGTALTILWDDNYPVCGNYWSDYHDQDLYSGSNQDVMGSDGIWDHGYVIDADNRDRYPITSIWPSQAILEDGFESGSFSQWTNTSLSSGETAAVVNDMSHHGLNSALFTSNGNGSEWSSCFKTMPSSAELYTRGYFQVKTNGIQDDNDRFCIIRFQAGTNSLVQAGWRKTSGVLKWCLMVRNGASWVTSYSDSTPSPNQWYCVELHWVESTTSGKGELWVDGSLICSITGQNTALYGDTNRVELGLPLLVSCGPTQVSVDCCVISREYIGLETPKLRRFTIEISGSGTTDPIPGTYWYIEGTPVSVESIPYSGWRLKYWLLDGADIGSEYPLNVTVDNNHTLTAVFVVSPPIFEDGFESGSLSNWSGYQISSGETASVVNSLPHHGMYSCMFASNGDGGYERTYCYKTINSSSELYVRGYFYVSQSGISDDYDSAYFIMLKARGISIAYAGWRRTGGVVKWNLAIGNRTGYSTIYSEASPSLNQWYCVELHWKKGSTDGLGELWVDGTLICTIKGKNTSTYGDVKQVFLGLAEIYNCGVTMAYCDCVKIGYTYVGPEQ